MNFLERKELKCNFFWGGVENIGCNLWKLIEDMQAFEHTS